MNSNVSPRRSRAERPYRAPASRRVRWVSLLLGLVAMAHSANAASFPASSPAVPGCGSAATQVLMNACAQDDFLAANGAYAKQYAALSASLGTKQRDRLRKMQGAWLRYRTEACRFESGPSAGGSVYDFVYWSCAARMTRARAAELMAQAECREGDVACTVTRP